MLNTLLDLDSAGLDRWEVDPGGKCEVLTSSSHRSPASSQTTAAPVTTAGEQTQARGET